MEAAAALYVGMLNTGIALSAWEARAGGAWRGLQANHWLATAWAALALLLILGPAMDRRGAESTSKASTNAEPREPKLN